MNLIETLAASPYGVWICWIVFILAFAGHGYLLLAKRFKNFRQRFSAVFIGTIFLSAFSAATVSVVMYHRWGDTFIGENSGIGVIVWLIEAILISMAMIGHCLIALRDSHKQ